jgi:tetracycline 7-halogenase / FADH2 O2-dependent halogenase
VAVDTTDFLVIGSGFGGSIMSMVLRRLGRSVTMVEQGRHPRFAIGESSTPFSNLLLEKLAEDYNLPFLKNLSEWGLWRKHFPELSVGLKRGFTFFHHASGPAFDFRDRSSQLLVAASPSDRVADTHWYRPELDHFLVRKAVELGTEYSDQTVIQAISQENSTWKVTTAGASGLRTISASFIIDASGSNGILAKYFPITTSKPSKTMPPTSGVWAHFRGVPRLSETYAALWEVETPYPVDDAAVHHVFPGGWMWVLKFNNGITSAGAAFSAEAGICGDEPSAVWSEVLQRVPALREQFRSSRAITPFHNSRQLSFARSEVAGSNWALLPATAGFVDPLLSTGFALNLLGVSRLGKVFESGSTELNSYMESTHGEIEAVADLVSALYAKMGKFQEFRLLTLLYFAAMSFSETAWRLGKQQLASGFLLGNDEIFTRERRRLCAAARAGEPISREEIRNAISRYDVAGLSDWTRNNHYPVDLSDLVANGHKLNADSAEINRLVRKLSL